MCVICESVHHAKLLWGLGIMTIKAIFQDLGKYECLRQAVKKLLSRIMKLADRCFSAVFGVVSCPGALVIGRLFIIDHTSLGVVNKFDLDLMLFIFMIERLISGRSLPGLAVNCPSIDLAKSSALFFVS